jgi:hypothetical protein
MSKQNIITAFYSSAVRVTAKPDEQKNLPEAHSFTSTT